MAPVFYVAKQATSAEIFSATSAIVTGRGTLNNEMNKKKLSHGVMIIVVGGSLACVLYVLVWFFLNTRSEPSLSVIEPQPTQAETSPAPTPEPAPVEATPKVTFDKTKLQNVLDDWYASIPEGSRASVVVTETDGTKLAEVNPDEKFFTASIYKLYVAYEGYRAVDAGDYKNSEKMSGTRSVETCLDVMIRESDSPCGEAMWVDLGKDFLDRKMNEYGLENTSMVSLSTTAADAAIMLSRIEQGVGLFADSRTKFLDSMRDQIYRDTLNKGFSNTVTVYNKIGFNEKLEYHDTAIVALADGRKIIVSVLTSEVGTRKIVSLAAALEAAF